MRGRGQPPHTQGHSFNELSRFSLKNVNNREYFEKTMALNPGEIYISPINLNREVTTGKLEIPYKPTIRVAVPLTNKKGRKEGIFIANLLAESLFEFTDSKSLKKDYDMTCLIINKQEYYLQ